MIATEIVVSSCLGWLFGSISYRLMWIPRILAFAATVGHEMQVRWFLGLSLGLGLVAWAMIPVMRAHEHPQALPITSGQVFLDRNCSTKPYGPEFLLGYRLSFRNDNSRWAPNCI